MSRSRSAKRVIEDPRDGSLLRMLSMDGVELEFDAVLARPPSREVALHAFAPSAHAALVEPDAVLALACAANGERLVREVFGNDVGWLGPTDDVERLEKTPAECRGVVIAGRGLLVFGETEDGCERNVVELVSRARDWLEPRLSDERAFGAIVTPAPSRFERAARAAGLLLTLRGRRSTRTRVVGCFDDSSEVLAFVQGARLDERRALVSDPALEWVPSLGLFAFGADVAEARRIAERAARTIVAIRGAESVDRFAGRADVEEPGRSAAPPSPLAGCVACIAGGEGDLARAIAARLAADGAHVAVLSADFSDEASVAAAFQRAVLASGGLDVLAVCDPGPATPTPLAQTSLELWRRMNDAPFLLAREAFRLLQAQQLGGSIVFVAERESELAHRLAREGVAHGIRVNTVAPGEHAAEGVAFLASDRSRGYTGNVLKARPGSA